MAHGIVKTAKLYRFFLEGVRLRHSVLLVYNERAFSVIVFPSDSPNFQIYFWKGERFERSELLVYSEGTFFPARTPRQGTLHDGFLVRVNSAVRRRKESYIRNPGIPSHSKQGTLHKGPLAARQTIPQKDLLIKVK